MQQDYKQEKWFLASTTVRAILLTLLPTIATILNLFGIELGNNVLMSLIDGFSIVCGVGAAVYLWMKRHKAAPLTLTKK